MSALSRGLTLVGFLVLPATCAADGLILRYSWTPYRSEAAITCVPAVPIMHYAPCPVLMAPLSMPYPAVGIPAQPANAYATPTPAPPSAAPATPGPAGPPTAPLPQVSESHAFFSAYTVAPRPTDKPAGMRCSVAFWNLSHRALNLKIDGHTHGLAPGKSVTLDLARQFVWQIEGREPQAEQVPPKESALEVVIRR